MASDIMPALNLHPRAKRFQTFKCITCRSTVKALLKTYTYAARCPRCNTRFTVSPAGTVCFQEEKPLLLGEETREMRTLKFPSSSKTQAIKTPQGFSHAPQTNGFSKKEILSKDRDTSSTSKTRSINRVSLARLVDSEVDDFPSQNPPKKSSAKLKKATPKKSSAKLKKVESQESTKLQSPQKKSSAKLKRVESQESAKLQSPPKKSSAKLKRVESQESAKLQSSQKKSSGSLKRIRSKESSGSLKRASSKESSKRVLRESGHRKHQNPIKGKVQRFSRMDVAPKSESELWHDLGLNVMDELDQVEKYLVRTTQRVQAIEADIVEAYEDLERTKITRSRKAGLMIFLMILPVLVGTFFLLSAIPNQGFTTKGEMKKHLTEKGNHLQQIFNQQKD